MYELGDLMLQVHETRDHRLDASFDVLDVGLVFDGGSAGAAFTVFVLGP